MKLPAGLSAAVRAGATLFALMGDQSRCRRGEGSNFNFFLLSQAAIANAVRSSFLFGRDQKIAAVIFYAENDVFPEWSNSLRRQQ